MINTLIIKVSSVCNMNCGYCYFKRNTALKTAESTMTTDVLRATIARAADYCEQHASKEFCFCWHGGEPLLAGYGLYEAIVQLQADLMPESTQLEKVVQTNGLLLNQRWVDLFKRAGFEIAVSLDGPASVHDARRRTMNGQSTHSRIVERLGLLKSSGLPIKILAVVTPEVLDYGGVEVYRYFRDLGCCWMDFLYPISNAMDNTLDSWVDPRSLGRFYCDVFDAWIEEGDPAVYVRTLHDFCMLLMGGRAITCHSRTDCSYVLTIGTDGEVYVCDDLAPYAESRLGHVFTDSLTAIEGSERLRRLSRSSVLFGQECRDCAFFPVCKGGCTLFRAKSTDDFHGRNHYCVAQKIIIRHIRDRLISMATSVSSRAKLSAQ